MHWTVLLTCHGCGIALHSWWKRTRPRSAFAPVPNCVPLMVPRCTVRALLDAMACRALAIDWPPCLTGIGRPWSQAFSSAKNHGPLRPPPRRTCVWDLREYTGITRPASSFPIMVPWAWSISLAENAGCFRLCLGCLDTRLVGAGFEVFYGRFIILKHFKLCVPLREGSELAMNVLLCGCQIKFNGIADNCQREVLLRLVSSQVLHHHPRRLPKGDPTMQLARALSSSINKEENLQGHSGWLVHG